MAMLLAQFSLCHAVAHRVDIGRRRLAQLVDISVEINPFTFHLDLGLVHTPGSIRRGLPAPSRTCDQRQIPGQPAVQRGMVHAHAALCHALFKVAIRHRVADIEERREQDHIPRKLRAPVPDRRSASVRCSCMNAMSGHDPLGSTAEPCNNYLWILLIQTAAYLGKLTVHPTPVPDLETFIRRADIGPLMPGEAVLTIGFLYILSWVALAVWIRRADERRIRERGGRAAMG